MNGWRGGGGGKKRRRPRVQSMRGERCIRSERDKDGRTASAARDLGGRPDKTCAQRHTRVGERNQGLMARVARRRAVRGE